MIRSRSAWYKGSVFYEIFPASFQDSNDDGIGDLVGLSTRVGYLHSLGVGVVRLNSIFPAKHYPDHFDNVTSLTDIDDVLGSKKELKIVIDSLHAKNMSLVLDLPIFPIVTQLTESRSLMSNGSSDEDSFSSAQNTHNDDDNLVLNAIKLWTGLGVDGFYVQGLENYHDDPYLLENVELWKKTIGADRVLMVNKSLLDRVNATLASKLIEWIDLVDVYLNISEGTLKLSDELKSLIKGGILEPGHGPYIQWSLGGITKHRTSAILPNATLPATLMQLMLPGSPSIFYGDEVSLGSVHDPYNDHFDKNHLHHLSTMQWNSSYQFTSHNTLPWLPRGAVSFGNIDLIAEMIALRDESPSIYQNVVNKTTKSERNTSVKFAEGDLLILERWYPRRRSFVSVTNLKNQKLSVDISSLFYGGEIVIGERKGEKILFSEFEIGGMETIVIRLDK